MCRQHEMEGVEEIPADTKPADEGRGQQQHDSCECGRKGNPRHADGRPDVGREQHAHSRHPGDEPQSHHTEAVERHHRVKPFRRHRGEEPSLQHAHQQPEHRQ